MSPREATVPPQLSTVSVFSAFPAYGQGTAAVQHGADSVVYTVSPDVQFFACSCRSGRHPVDFFIYVCGCFLQCHESFFFRQMERILPLPLPENFLEGLDLGRQLSLPGLFPCPVSPFPLVPVLFPVPFLYPHPHGYAGQRQKDGWYPRIFFPFLYCRGSGLYGYGIRRLHQPPVFYLPGFDGNMFSRKGCIFGIGNRFPERCSTFPAVTSVRFCKFSLCHKGDIISACRFP